MSDQDSTPAIDLDDTEGHVKAHGRDDEAADDTEGHVKAHGRDDEAEDDAEGHIKA